MHCNRSELEQMFWKRGHLVSGSPPAADVLGVSAMNGMREHVKNIACTTIVALLEWQICVASH